MIETHRTNGAYPDTLKAWPQDAIEDPFTGVPLIYRRKANGFLLYSLGPNRNDDNGQVNAKGKQEGDIAWQYHQPQ